MAGIKTDQGRAQRAAIVAYLRSWKRLKRPYPPTQAEISRDLQMPYTTLQWHLGKLREQGYVKWKDGRVTQTLSVTGKHLRTLE